MNVKLSDRAVDALRDLALKERRDVRHEAEWILEQELQRRGLIVEAKPRGFARAEQDR